jgi:hypothetical protein
MITSDEPVFLFFDELTFRTVAHTATALALLGIFVYHRLRYKVWNWLALTLAIIMIAPVALIAVLDYFVFKAKR